MDISIVQFVGHIVAWSILVVGYFLMGMLVYHTVKRVMKEE
jgi:hypothetical protein|nr:MAG TPA: hypothetical protein [Caudoviricetes sp.]